MPKANVDFSTDGLDYWKLMSANDKIDSNYGWQMAIVKNNIWGITTLGDKSLAAASFETGFRTVLKLPAQYKALGRVSVATPYLQDRCYVAYRGTNDGVYLVYTDDFERWTDLGRIGSKYAKTTVAPAIATYVFRNNDDEPAGDKVVLSGVGGDKYVYYTTVDVRSGKRDMSWTKISGTGTQSALAMTSYGGREVILAHTAYNNGAFFYQSYQTRTNTWSGLVKVAAPDISSGVSMVLVAGVLVVAYKGRGGRPYYTWYDYDDDTDNGEWAKEQQIWDVEMLYQLGLTATGNATAVASVPVNYPDEKTSYKGQA